VAGSDTNYELDDYAFGLANHLGVRYNGRYVSWYLPSDFDQLLAALEYLVSAMPPKQSTALDQFIRSALKESPADLQVDWRNDRFLPHGVAVLDKPLVDEPYEWLTAKGLKGVVKPFGRAIEGLIKARRDPEMRWSVIRDAYEALEAAAQQVCANDRELSGNRELLIKMGRLSPIQGAVLPELVKSGNLYRHGKKAGLEYPTYEFSEEYVYQIGVVLRALQPALDAEPEHVSPKPRPRTTSRRNTQPS
jgi:hypothetical protein